MAATADAWLYGIAVPSVGSEPGPARSAEIQLRPTSAMLRVIEPCAAGRARPGFGTVLSPLILRHRSSPRHSRTLIDGRGTPRSRSEDAEFR